MTLHALPHVHELLPEVPDLPRLATLPKAADLAPDTRRRTADYLAQATCLIAVSRREDPRDPARGPIVDFSVLTDGEWVWPAYWAYLVTECGVAPPRAFLDHVSSRDFAPRELSEAELIAVDEQRGDAIVVLDDAGPAA